MAIRACERDLRHYFLQIDQEYQGEIVGNWLVQTGAGQLRTQLFFHICDTIYDSDEDRHDQ